MTRHLAWLVLLIAIVSVAEATLPATEPHLIPVDPGLAEFGVLGRYKVAVRDRLLGQRLSSNSVVVFPSFQKEWALQIARDRGQPFVFYALPESQIWGMLQQRAEQTHLPEADVLKTLHVAVAMQTAPLSPEAMGAVESAWADMLSAAIRPPQFRRIIDGTSYLFFSVDPGGSTRAGLTRSPEAGTPAAALTRLVDALRQHVVSPSPDRQRTGAEVLRQAEQVLTTMRDSRP